MGKTLQILGLSAALGGLVPRYVPGFILGGLSSTIWFFFLFFTAWQTYRIVIYPRFLSPLRGLPEAPDAHFFTGQTRRIMAEPSGSPMRDWAETVPNSGLIRYSVWFQERLLITTPQALSEVLVTKNYDFVKPYNIRNGLGRILGVGVLLAEGDEHKQQRKSLMPAFAFRHVKNIYPVFWKKAREMVDCIAVASKTSDADPEKVPSDSKDRTSEPQHAKGAIDVGNWTSRATLDIIGLSGMGQDFNALQDPDNKLNQTYKRVFSTGRPGRLLQLAGIFLPFWFLRRLPIKRNHDINGASEYIKEVCRDLIAKKRKAIASEKGRSDVDILSVALESGGFPLDEDLVNQMMTFLVAGHETTATAMIWAIYLLCKHPDIQTKLREEIRAHIPSINEDITAAQIDDCHYLQAVCSEVLRLWSPISLTMRVSDKDTSIQGQFVPKGTLIILCPWAINRNTGLWGSDALEFNPSRWINPGDGKSNAIGGAQSNFSFLTFLHGPRSCIGQKFAVAEFACLLAAWVGRYDTRFEEGSLLAKGQLDIQGGVTSKPKGGVWCKLKEVEGW